MKRLSVPLLAGALLAATLTTPAQAAAADPAPTDVTVQWTDEDLTTVRLSWAEASPQPNEILLQNNDDTPIGRFWVPADAPNHVDLPKSAIAAGYTNLRFGVAVGTEDERTSPLAMSPRFDTSLPAAPELVGAVPSGGSTLSVEWKAGQEPVDLTRNDPLDRALPLAFGAWYQVGDQPRSYFGPMLPGGTRGAFNALVPEFTVSVDSRNEWGETTAKLIDAAASAPTLNVPAWVVYDNLLDLTGKLAGTDARTVNLEARNSPTSPWYVVTSRLNTTGSYMYTFQHTPSRQYRVEVPNRVSGSRVWYGGYSPIGTSNVQHKVNASFPTPTVKRGDTARATLGVLPGHNGTATLQRYVGTAWTTVGSVQFTNGLGDGYVRSTTPGRVSYRYYVPTATVAGGTYQAAYSPTFVLTTT
ncbi:hypothetical protein [Kribbella sp. DT2]|uniref:hypothetical protein n=1 Tax=Kribbella sp. DT2 TaxID=3393427 RepID=UPI003CF43D96